MTNCVSIQARKYFLIIFQVLIVFFFFFSEIVNYDFLKKKSFSSKEAAFEKMLILIV